MKENKKIEASLLFISLLLLPTYVLSAQEEEISTALSLRRQMSSGYFLAVSSYSSCKRDSQPPGDGA